MKPTKENLERLFEEKFSRFYDYGGDIKDAIDKEDWPDIIEMILTDTIPDYEEQDRIVAERAGEPPVNPTGTVSRHYIVGSHSVSTGTIDNPYVKTPTP